MKRSVVAAAVVAAGLGLTLAFAQRPDKPAAEPADAPANAAAEEGIKKMMAGYAEAYAKGDLDALMAFWADTAEFIDDEGHLTRGKKALREMFKAGLEDHKGVKMTMKKTSMRVLRPDLAMLDGVIERTDADGSRDSAAYSAVLTHGANGWQLLSVRDLPDDDAAAGSAAASQLKQLGWLVGQWKHEDNDRIVNVSVRWSNKQAFLITDQKVIVKGEEILSLTNVIGWDPLRGQLHSWVFDSTGGFGEALWAREGNTWTVDSDGVLADGRPASAINVYRYIDDNSFEWSSTHREIDDEPAPDIKVKYVRVGKADDRAQPATGDKP